MENVRGFSGPRNVDLTLTRPDGSHAGWTVIAGRNGSGKTSLLQAIALAVGGPITTAALNYDFRKWITTGQEQATVEVQLQVARAIDDPWDKPGKESVKRITGSLTWIDLVDQGSSKPGGLPSFGATTSPHIGLDGPWGANPYGWFCAAYGPFRRLVGGTSEAQRLMSSPGPAGRLASLFHEDASLAEGVQWLIEMHLRALEGDELRRRMKGSALQLLGDDLFPQDYQISDVTSDGLWVRHQGDRFPLREMSDGYRTVAALVIDLLSRLYNSYGPIQVEDHNGAPAVMNPGVVLIDEVDAHLHVTWQQQIAGWLKRHFPNIQFIVTTHSPYICQSADPGGLVRLPGLDEQKPPEVVDKQLHERVVYGSGDDAVLSELFGLESPYSERAEELRRELVALERRVVTGRASEAEAAHYEELGERLNSSLVARTDEVAARLRPADDVSEAARR